MGLFSKKKPAAPAAAPTPKPVDPDDIWNTPSPKRRQTVIVKESKYDDPMPENLEVESVDPEMIKSKMAQLEAELEEKKNQPIKTHADYGTSTVAAEEIIDAQTEYERLYEVEHEKYVKSHQEEISVAKEQGMAEKMEAMYAEHEAKVAEVENTDFEFSEVGQAEVDKKMIDLPYAKKPEDYPEYKDIAAVSAEPDQAELDKLGVIDHSEDPDNIGNVDEELLARKVEEFEAKYGDRKKA
ncbi:hypothetical protein [uncultured Ruminococcus sp.]|uniref:hypothetical protein n=1 Tax=uncultured Ruminococcus sp. TaxID=165186 RepID=UPI000EDC81F3|nr:hypothetical protein [uncultured Ruminococcus sp.]HCJ41044.1 hypothetical protein [Ruminococcus sp.]